MTYQLGAENLGDPYVDDTLVSLSELRDVLFFDLDKFACGSNFVIGQSSIVADKQLRTGTNSPLKEADQQKNEQAEPQFKGMSPIKAYCGGDEPELHEERSPHRLIESPDDVSRKQDSLSTPVRNGSSLLLQS